jgi:hypothetical protein
MPKGSPFPRLPEACLLALMWTTGGYGLFGGYRKAFRGGRIYVNGSGGVGKVSVVGGGLGGNLHVFNLLVPAKKLCTAEGSEATHYGS